MRPIRTFIAAGAVSLFSLSAIASTGAGAGNYADLIGAGEGGQGAGAWSATNPGSTATGRYQFLYDNFVRYGYIDGSRSTRPRAGAGEWTGVVWTGKDGVYSRSDYMNNHAAQDNMLNLYTQDNWNSISGSTPLGSTVNGVPITQGGALYAAHMLGAGAYNTWAACGYQPQCLDADIAAAHGWTLQEYNDHLMKRMAEGGGTDPSLVASSGGNGGVTDSIDWLDLNLMPWT